MKPIESKTDKETSSPPPKESSEGRMMKPPLHTTKYGTQYVNIIDIIESDAGWAEIKRLKDANLVEQPRPERDPDCSTPSNDGGVA